MVYTIDDWETHHCADLALVKVQLFGTSHVGSPNEHSVSYYKVNLGFKEGTRVEYAIKVENSQGVFWDDNFGMNYKETPAVK